MLQLTRKYNKKKNFKGKYNNKKVFKEKFISITLAFPIPIHFKNHTLKYDANLVIHEIDSSSKIFINDNELYNKYLN